MMADLARIKRNVAKMAGMGAPEADIDGYIASEGVTVEQVRDFKGGPTQITGKVTPQTSVPGPSSNVEIAPQAQQPPNLLDTTNATLAGLTSSVPFLNNLSDAIVGVAGMPFGKDYGETVSGLQQRRAGMMQKAPIAATAGTVAGMLAPYAAATKVPALASALGMSGSLPQRVVNSALSGGALSAADAMSQPGNNLGDAIYAGGIGGAVGGAIPLAGAGIKAAARAAFRPAVQTVKGAINPAGEAAKAVGSAFSRDRAAGNVMTSLDEATARMNGQPILNVDRGGTTTRALMRSAANQNPEARGVVERLAEDRFRTQAPRAVQFFNRIMGGNVDDLARKAQIKARSQQVVTPAYQRAMNSPAAQAVFSRPIQELLQGDAMQAAIAATNKMGTNVAAIAGTKRIPNPFHLAPDGRWKLRTDARGQTVLPSLAFWDQVKKNLDDMITRAGAHTYEGSLLTQTKQKLVGALDAAVPSYRDARGLAMQFFDATDAVDAGRKAFSVPKAIDESLAAFRSMTAAEKKDFGLGLVSQAMDDIRAGNNRANLTRMFDSEARTALMREALGAGKYQQFEAFVRVEDLMDKVRGALGNSTTARQLVELGLVNDLRQSGGAGALGGATAFVTSGGNLSTAATVAMLTAAGRAGFRAVGNNVNARVLQNVAELLASGNQAALNKAMANAALSEQHMEALKAIEAGLGATLRATSRVAVAAQ